MACRYCTEKDSDWLEVLLTNECNGTCSWCVEKNGWHPKKRATTDAMIAAMIRSGKKNILLLGGEPTFHPDIHRIIRELVVAGLKTILTTNGTHLTRDFVRYVLHGVAQVNISIHASSLAKNERITGIPLNGDDLLEAVAELHNQGAKVRLNCNCIRGHIDTAEELEHYIRWAKTLGVDSIRFAELSGDTDLFVDLAKITDLLDPLSDDPWADGCVRNTVIDGMPVYFKQLCGFQTRNRPWPDDDPSKIVRRPVLYYDGNLYLGWQRKESHMCNSGDDRAVTRAEFNTLMKKLDEVTAGVAALSRHLPAPPDLEDEKKQREKDAETMDPHDWVRKYPMRSHPETGLCHY